MKKRKPARVSDHIDRFVTETFEPDPLGFCNLSAFLRCYSEWCHMHNIVNRQIPSLVLLNEVEKRYGASARTVCISQQRDRIITADPTRERANGSKAISLYALAGLRMKAPELNLRREARRGYASKAWQRVSDGTLPDVALSIEEPELKNPFDDED